MCSSRLDCTPGHVERHPAIWLSSLGTFPGLCVLLHGRQGMFKDLGRRTEKRSGEKSVLGAISRFGQVCCFRSFVFFF